jgi:hypothetical protein
VKLFQIFIVVEFRSISALPSDGNVVLYGKAPFPKLLVVSDFFKRRHKFINNQGIGKEAPYPIPQTEITSELSVFATETGFEEPQPYRERNKNGNVRAVLKISAEFAYNLLSVFLIQVL